MTDDDWNADLPTPAMRQRLAQDGADAAAYGATALQKPMQIGVDPGELAMEETAMQVSACTDEGARVTFLRLAKGCVIYCPDRNLHLTFSGEVGERLLGALAQLVELKP